MKRRSRTLCAPIVASFIFLPLCMIALAADSFPKGYLVPTPASIPAGMMQIERPYSPYSENKYVLEYMSPNPGGKLIISEDPANPDWNYGGMVHGYEIRINHSIRSNKNCTDNVCPLLSGAEKIRDIDYMGVHGVLYHTVQDSTHSPDTGGFDLLMDDNSRLLRIQAYDGPNFHFTDDMIMNVLHGLVRQN